MSSFPELWKCTRIVSIPQKRDLSSPGNYHPISIFSLLSKLLQRQIYHIVSNHCTIQFLTGSGASPVVSQPLLPYCPSLTTVHNPSIIKLRCAQYSLISARISIQSHMLIYSKNYPRWILTLTLQNGSKVTYCAENNNVVVNGTHAVLTTTYLLCLESHRDKCYRYPPIPYLH